MNNQRIFFSRREILLTFFILTLAVSSFGQTLSERADGFNNKRAFHKKNYKVEYDKFKEQTRVHFSNIRIEEGKKSKSGAGGILLGVTFFFDGEILKTNVDDYFLIFQAVCSNWCFLDNHDLRFIADDKKLNLGEGEHSGKVGNIGLLRYEVGTKEAIVYKINRNDLTVIADAKISEFQLGNYEAALTEKRKQMLKNMLDLGTVK